MTSKTNSRPIPLFVVDAFADEPFSGNPAAVCLLSKKDDVNEEQKQLIAAEMNQSETAFIQIINPGDSFEKSSEFKLQWFTPVAEVNLCGHATLASSATIFFVKGNQSKVLTFHTRSGKLLAEQDGNMITIDLPLNPCTDQVPDFTDKLIKHTLGTLKPIDVKFAPGANSEILMRLPDAVTREEFEALTPDLTGMMDIHHQAQGCPGVIVTVKGGKEKGAADKDGVEFDFLSRYFDPWNAIDEDPVTGAAHAVLAGYWSSILGKTGMYARQCSKRGGNLKIKVTSDGRVKLSGNARVVLQGKLHLPR